MTLQIVSGLSAAVVLAAGAALVAGYMDAQFTAWGYPPGVHAAIGFVMMTGAIALVFRRTAGWSAVGLMVIMAVAIWNHGVMGNWTSTIAPAVMLVVLALIAWSRGLPMQTKAPPPPATGPEPQTAPL